MTLRRKIKLKIIELVYITSELEYIRYTAQRKLDMNKVENVNYVDFIIDKKTAFQNQITLLKSLL